MIGVSMFYNVLQEKPISHDVSSQATVVDPFGYPHSSPANRSAIAARMQVGRVTKLTSCQDSAPPGKSQMDENAETQMASVMTRALRQNLGDFFRKQPSIAYSWVLSGVWKHNLSLIESFMNSQRLDLVPPRCSPRRREAPRVTGLSTFGYPPKSGPWRSIHRQPHMRFTSWLRRGESPRGAGRCSSLHESELRFYPVSSSSRPQPSPFPWCRVGGDSALLNERSPRECQQRRGRTRLEQQGSVGITARRIRLISDVSQVAASLLKNRRVGTATGLLAYSIYSARLAETVYARGLNPLPPKGVPVRVRERASIHSAEGSDRRCTEPGKPRALQLGAVRAGVVAAYSGDSLERQATLFSPRRNNWPVRYPTRGGQAAFLGGGHV